MVEGGQTHSGKAFGWRTPKNIKKRKKKKREGESRSRE
jgi:hypothetical protein